MIRIAIVTPWFGRDLHGGAEQQAWQLAHQLADEGHVVDVLATCSQSFNHDWGRNYFSPGVERLGKISIRRFKVSPRDRRAFERVNAILLSLDVAKLHRSVSPLGDDDARTFYDNNINSAALNAYLATDGARYDRFVFLPYLYGTTLQGLPLVADRAYVQPCLHDEAYAYLSRVEDVVHRARGLLLNSEGEFELALRLFGPGIYGKATVVGEGVDLHVDPTQFAARVGTFVPAHEKYVLYLGRQDPAKNVGTLVVAFSDFKRRNPTSRMKLVLAGERPVSYGDSTKAIVDLGPVNEREKAALLAHARALAQPSLNESYSRVIYEAWAHGRPVIVHRDCLPTQTAVSRSEGGYLADSIASWEATLNDVDFAPDADLARLGLNGRAYARDVASWPNVIDRYERVFANPIAAGRNGHQLRADVVDPNAWDRLPDLALSAALHDGKFNLIYAGPIVDLGHINELLLTFLHFLTIESEARLAIVGTAPIDDSVYAKLYEEVRKLDMVDRVLVTRDIEISQKLAIFRAADLFITLDDADVPDTPFVEASWFDVPILAYASPSAKGNVAGAGILVRSKDDLLSIAALAHMLVTDRDLRANVIAAQRQRRELPAPTEAETPWPS